MDRALPVTGWLLSSSEILMRAHFLTSGEEIHCGVSHDLGRDIMGLPHVRVLEIFQGMKEGLLIEIHNAKKEGDTNRIMELSNALIYLNLTCLHLGRASGDKDSK